MFWKKSRVSLRDRPRLAFVIFTVVWFILLLILPMAFQESDHGEARLERTVIAKAESASQALTGTVEHVDTHRLTSGKGSSFNGLYEYCPRIAVSPEVATRFGAKSQNVETNQICFERTNPFGVGQEVAVAFDKSSGRFVFAEDRYLQELQLENNDQHYIGVIIIGILLFLACYLVVLGRQILRKKRKETAESARYRVIGWTLIFLAILSLISLIPINSRIGVLAAVSESLDVAADAQTYDAEIVESIRYPRIDKDIFVHAINSFGSDALSYIVCPVVKVQLPRSPVANTYIDKNTCLIDRHLNNGQHVRVVRNTNSNDSLDAFVISGPEARSIRKDELASLRKTRNIAFTVNGALVVTGVILICISRRKYKEHLQSEASLMKIPSSGEVLQPNIEKTSYSSHAIQRWEPKKEL